MGEILRKKRKTKKLISEQLARKIGVDRSYLSKLENDLKIPSQVIYERIDSVLNLGPAGEYYYQQAKNSKSANWLKSKYGLRLPPTSLKQAVHELITKHIKSSKNSSDDIAFCAELVANFIPSEKDDDKLAQELAGIIRKLRQETEDFQKRFLKTEKKIMDLIKPE